MGTSWSRGNDLERRWFGAVQNGDAEGLRSMAVQNINPSIRDCRGLTALMVAAAKGHEACIVLLIQLGADLEACDGRGWTAVTHAAVTGKDRSLRLLAECGANLDAKDFLGTTPAMRAAIGGHDRCLRLLVEHGADLKAEDNLGLGAAAHARRKGRVTCVHILEASDASMLPKSLLISASRRRVLEKEFEASRRAWCGK